MKKIAFVFVLLAAQTVCLFSQQLTVSEIMAEPSIAGMRVEGEKLSPDGKTVAFLWNAAGKMPPDLYLVSSSGGELRKILSPKDLLTEKAQPEKENKLDYGLIVKDEFVKERENQLGNLAWSPDSKKLLLTQNGDLFLINLEGKNEKPRRLTKTQSAEFAAQWLDDQKILFAQNGNFFVIDMENFSLIQISKEANPQASISVSSATPSENKEFIAYIVSDASKQKSIVVPNYIDELVQAPTVRRGFSEQKVVVAKADGSFEKSMEIELPKAENDSYIQNLEWLADNKTLIVDRVDKTHKRRQIYAARIENEKANAFLVHEEQDEKWIGGPSNDLEANPKNAAQFFFVSEKDGWNHIYSVNLDQTKFAGGKANAEIKQLTKGNWEVNWARWIADGKQIIYSSTENNPAERNFFVYDFETAENYPAFKNLMLAGKNGKTLSENSPQIGMKTNPQIDEENSQPVLIYSFSKWNQPDEIYSYRVCPRCGRAPLPVQLTKTAPESFLKRKWNEPKFVEIASRDNKKIPAKIYLPENFNKSKKYPMVVFVHGAGYLQNIINGWNNYYREFMFNELLTQKGYVVLDIDYRGSAGYGRDWRTDVYDFLGGTDFDDHIDAIDYMVANYAVDAKRVGAYGGSYGGFMAAMLVMRAPDKIAAAAALRPVMDWRNYYAINPFYTSQRLRSPKENPEAYKRSSPISYADKLEKPLLILHGLVDSNVQVQDSFQLIEKLIRLNKTPYFEEMIYPSENHSFTRPTSWTDEYTRILNFFEKHLK